MSRLLVLLLLLAAGPANAVVILVYHHVDEDAPASTSVTPREFREHLEFIEKEGFEVLSLRDVVEAFRNNRPLSSKTIVITFDDAYRSIKENAMPMLEARDWPFSVFVATDAVDAGFGNYMSWDDLRTLSQNGAEIENHGASHLHMVRRLDDESDRQRIARIRDDVTRAQARLAQELGDAPQLFAFPYGEYDRQAANIVADLGLVGVGQHSGAAHAGQLGDALMRFPVNRQYADLSSLRNKIRSLPLPFEVLSPDDGVLGPDAPAPTIRLKWPDGLEARPDQLRCFVSGQPQATLEWQGNVVEVTATRPLPPGRSKYNCTVPSTAEPGRFHWFSAPWIKPRPGGEWVPE